MLVIKNVQKLKHTQLMNDWTISHVFSEYTNEIGKEYYIFQLTRTGGIASTTISLEKEATQGTIDLDTHEKKMLYEVKGPAGTINVYLDEIRNRDTFITKLNWVC